MAVLNILVKRFRLGPVLGVCQRLSYRLFRPITTGVRILCVDQANQVLLVRHSYLRGWHLPGGGIGRGETLTAAALRELWEETGVRGARVDRILGTYSRIRPHHTNFISVLVVTDWRQEAPPETWEIAESGFFDVDVLPPDTTYATGRRIREYLGEDQVSLDW